MRRGSEWHAWLAPGNQTTCNKAAGDAAHLVERKERKAGKEWGTERCKAMGQWSTQISCGDPVVVPVFLFELQIQLRLPIRFTTHGVVCDWVAKRALCSRNLATVVRPTAFDPRLEMGRRQSRARGRGVATGNSNSRGGK